MKCAYCGTEIPAGSNYCAHCGGKAVPEASNAQPVVFQQPPVYPLPSVTESGATEQKPEKTTHVPTFPASPNPLYNPYAPPAQSAQGIDTAGQIIFSVINILIGFGIITFITAIFGIIALVFTLSVNNQPTFEAGRSKLKTARTLNIIGILFYPALILVILFFVFVVMFVIALASPSNPSYSFMFLR